MQFRSLTPTRLSLLVCLLASMSMSMSMSVSAWTTSTSTGTGTGSGTGTRTAPNPGAAVSRQDALKILGGASAAAALLAFSPPARADTTPAGVAYEVVKKGDGPKPEIGELTAIRFSAFAGANKIDDIFDSPEPYYTRVGSGGLLQGVESTLPLMRLGDRWKLTIPGNLAFGSKGRPASAGKPRVPADAEIIFEVEIVGLPGKEPELIDLIGDE